MICVDMLLV